MEKIVFRIGLLLFMMCKAVVLPAQDRQIEKDIDGLISSYNFKDAIKLADIQLKSDTGNTTLLLLKSKALSGLFQYRQSSEVLMKAYLLDTSNTLILAELANVCQKKGDTRNAARYYDKARLLQPANTFFSLQLAGLYLTSENYRKCLELLLPLNRVDSSNLYSFRLIGDCYFNMAINDSAESWYKKILLSSPYDLYATQKLANLYIRIDQYDKGRELTEGYLKQDTGLNPVRKLNAYFYYLLKDYKTATSVFLHCIRSGDSSLFVFRKLGLSYYRQDKFDSAITFFRYAALSDTTDAETSFYYGVSASRSYYLDTALLYLGKTLKLVMPEEQFLTNIYVELAESYNNQGKKEEALKVLEKIHAIFPENKRLYFRIAYQWDYYFRDTDKALEYYRLFLKDMLPATAKTSEGTEMSYEDYARNRISEIQNKKQKK